jgi:putative ABC transport system ATP-binding protein
MLELERTRKLYESPGEVIHAVEDVSMSVRERELVALLGPSGSGKTTLLLLVAGLLRADGGSVRFEGRDLGTLSKREALSYRRTKLGFIFQGFNLSAGLTAEENVALPLLLRGVAHGQAHRRARAALDEVGLARRFAHTPERLSGGEQQRVAIARALVGEPRLILADEATGSLDTETGDAVLELLSALPRERGAAVILVTHDARATRHADRVLGMRDGRLSEADPPGAGAGEPDAKAGEPGGAGEPGAKAGEPGGAGARARLASGA